MSRIRLVAIIGYACIGLVALYIAWLAPLIASKATPYERYFSTAVTCYTQNDYPCAQEQFALAVWNADTPSQRSPALFNLANTHFFMGEYTQAKILFHEAKLEGANPEAVKFNLAFAESLEASMKQLIRDIQKSDEKSQWRAESRALPDDLFDQLAEGILFEFSASNPQSPTHSADTLKTMIKASLAQAVYNRLPDAGARRWIPSLSYDALNSSDLMSRVMRLELGLPNTTDPIPAVAQGHRAW